MNRYAVIDIGSNSIRLLKCDVHEGKIVAAEKDLIMTRLGQGVNEQKMLSESAMVASYEALEVFKKSAEEDGAFLLGAFATSAVRDSYNQEHFVSEAKRFTGVDVSVIDGDREAKLGYLGVLAGLSTPADVLMVIDIGGGSTEIIIGNRVEILYAKSFDMGAVRMTEMFLPSDPPKTAQLEALSANVQSVAEEIKAICERYRPQVAVGIGGTITTLGAVALAMQVYDRDKIHNYELSEGEIQGIFDAFRERSLEARMNLPGLQPKRADIIVAGTVILQEILKLSAFSSVRISDYDNLEGILAEQSIL